MQEETIKKKSLERVPRKEFIMDSKVEDKEKVTNHPQTMSKKWKAKSQGSIRCQSDLEDPKE